jgi:integrase
MRDHTAVLSGMRLGESLAMKWNHLDWQRRQYFVKESVYNGKFVEPKSATSKRAINLAPTLIVRPCVRTEVDTPNRDYC